MGTASSLFLEIRLETLSEAVKPQRLYPRASLKVNLNYHVHLAKHLS